MTDSCEFSAFRCCFSSLQEGIQYELSGLVPKLFAKNLVSHVNRDQSLSRTDPPGERAAHLLKVLESRIHGDPASFHSILQELDSCPTLKYLAMKLRSELDQVKREREPQQEPTEVFLTENVSVNDCGPSPTTGMTGSQYADVQSTALHSNTKPAEGMRLPLMITGEWGEGGYNCEFIEAPPNILQTDCSVCHLILREPTMVTCCGYSFCQTCIKQVQAIKKICPLCGNSEFMAVPDKKLQRLLNEQQVRCVKKGAGCEWTGKLGSLDEHLNVIPKPSLKRRLEGCTLMKIECSMCHEFLQRHTIAEHENNQCPQRPYSCVYCKEYKASFKDVVDNHYPECKCYPLPCPNKCDELPDGFKYMIERQNLEHHLTEECILRPVECDFHYVGCGVKLPKKDMMHHLAESLVTHMSLLAVHSKKAAADAQKTTANSLKALEERDKQIAQLREDTKQRDKITAQTLEGVKKALELRDRQIAQLRKDIRQRDKDMSQIQEELQELKRENKALKERADSNFDRLHSHLNTPPVTFTMTNFMQHKKNKVVWYSPSFYSHPHGYKLCAMVICKEDRCFIGTKLMRGEFDDSLQWPFQSDVYIRILNRLTDDNYITITVGFSCNLTFSNRVMVGERQEYGPSDGIPYATLNCHGDSTENCQYLRHDCIQLQVARVLDTVQLQREIVATISHSFVCTPPCQFIMKDFAQHKKDNDFWYSPSFTTHSQGYRMCLSVVANGISSGKGTHVSVFTLLMCGEFDSCLKWPFQGDITIQLLNQLEDKQHHTMTNDYTSITPDGYSCRVTVGERGRGWGLPYFIPHSELGLNRARNCQYLQNNCLIFKITKIDLKII